jgi:uncharacterized protein YceK
MKKIIVLIVLLIAVLFLMSNCSSHTVHAKSTKAPEKTLPPGQMKKLTGSQSAKQYAPGQQKKQTATVEKSTSKKK